VRQAESPPPPLPPRTPWGREDEPGWAPPRPDSISRNNRSIWRYRSRLFAEVRSLLKWLGGTGPPDDVVLPQRALRAMTAGSPFSRVFARARHAGSKSKSAWADHATQRLAQVIRKDHSAEAKARQLVAVAKNIGATVPVTTEDVMIAAEKPTRTTRFRSGWFLHPLGLPRLAWDSFVLLCLLYCGWVRPSHWRVQACAMWRYSL
jgi:hypothetical protein